MRSLQEEKQVQATGWLYFNFGYGLALLLCLILWNNHHQFVAAIGGIVIIAMASQKWEELTARFAERMEAIVYMQQVESLYCVSQSPDDEQVASICREQIDLFAKYNNHEVRVHLIMFRRPLIFTYWIGRDGKTQRKSTEREGIIANETFEQFQQFAEQWCIAERDKRRRELDGIKEGQWAEEFIYHQDFSENGKATQN